MAMEHNEYFINFDNAEVNVQLEGRRKQARRGDGIGIALSYRVESSDPTNSPWDEKSGFNKCIVWCGRGDQKAVKGCRCGVNRLHP